MWGLRHWSSRGNACSAKIVDVLQAAGTSLHVDELLSFGAVATLPTAGFVSLVPVVVLCCLPSGGRFLRC